AALAGNNNEPVALAKTMANVAEDGGKRARLAGLPRHHRLLQYWWWRRDDRAASQYATQARRRVERERGRRRGQVQHARTSRGNARGVGVNRCSRPVCASVTRS